tara:strand:- start:1295 stop:1762 length:468 start_codon:yes stop_codon:yes gene_type:complete
MKLSNISVAISLTVLGSGLAAVRSPTAETLTGQDLSSNALARGAKAEVAVLFESDKHCDTVHVATWVGCWWLPTKTAPGTDLVKRSTATQTTSLSNAILDASRLPSKASRKMEASDQVSVLLTQAALSTSPENTQTSVTVAAMSSRRSMTLTAQL